MYNSSRLPFLMTKFSLSPICFAVDDSYILVGSANINQRSMAGTRDTEMAIGSHQPSYPPHHPYGDVHAFRMSLFAQWFKKGDPAFIHPGTIDCVQKVCATRI